MPLVDKETIYNLIFDTPQCVNDISIFYGYLVAGTNWICVNLMITTSQSKTLTGKGQLNSKWIYEVKAFPKMPTKNNLINSF